MTEATTTEEQQRAATEARLATFIAMSQAEWSENQEAQAELDGMLTAGGDNLIGQVAQASVDFAHESAFTEAAPAGTRYALSTAGYNMLERNTNYFQTEEQLRNYITGLMRTNEDILHSIALAEYDENGQEIGSEMVVGEMRSQIAMQEVLNGTNPPLQTFGEQAQMFAGDGSMRLHVTTDADLERIANANNAHGYGITGDHVIIHGGVDEALAAAEAGTLGQVEHAAERYQAARAAFDLGASPEDVLRASREAGDRVAAGEPALAPDIVETAVDDHFASRPAFAGTPDLAAAALGAVAGIQGTVTTDEQNYPDGVPDEGVATTAAVVPDQQPARGIN